MEAYGADINDFYRLLPGGKQCILMDGYQGPLVFKNSLPYLQCQTPTEDELASLPHIMMTSDVDWYPSVYDKDIDDLANVHAPSEDDHENHHFDQYGEYRHRTVATHSSTCVEEAIYDSCEFLKFGDQVDQCTQNWLVSFMVCILLRSLRLHPNLSCFDRSLG
jgi:hypothetical protein